MQLQVAKGTFYEGYDHYSLHNRTGTASSHDIFVTRGVHGIRWRIQCGVTAAAVTGET